MICKMFIKILKNIILEKKCKVLTVFDDMITDMINNKKLNPIVTELFIRGRTISFPIVLIIQSCFKVPTEVRLNSTQFYYENSKQKRTSTNCNKSFIRY